MDSPQIPLNQSIEELPSDDDENAEKNIGK